MAGVYISPEHGKRLGCTGTAATITQVLENDPRPGYITGSSDVSGRVYGIRLFDVEVKWQVTDKTALVLSIEPSGHIASQ